MQLLAKLRAVVQRRSFQSGWEELVLVPKVPELEVVVAAPRISWRRHIVEFGTPEFPMGYQSEELLVLEGRRKSRRRVHLM